MLPSEQTLEVNQIQLKLKSSLRFSYRAGDETPWYVVEDESTGKFFQIGLPQYTFLSLLDGNRTVGEALMRSASLLHEHALTDQDVASFSKWAIESGLVESEWSNSTFRRNQAEQSEFSKQSLQWMNPISLKIPLIKPDPWLARVQSLFRWAFSPLFALVWIVVVVSGFLQLAMSWDLFINHRVSSFASSDLLWFVVAWLGLKVIHEFAHAITCKQFGGKVQNSGILLLLLIPLPFVDVTSSWRFANRWHRILTSAAGMLSEIFIAAIACWIWTSCEPGPLQFHTGNLIIAATLHTLLFNANPLMRFDGYYILKDLVSTPNLYTHGRGYVKSLFSWLYLGKKIKPLGELGTRGWFVRLYGFGSFAWFGVISVSLMLGAMALFEGFGLLLAAVGILLWFGLPIFRLAKFVAIGSETEVPNRKWFFIATGLTMALLFALFFCCPAPATIKAPIVVDYLPPSDIRSRSAGFLESIHVRQGQFVSEGTLVASLSNPELNAELESLAIDLKVSQLKIKSLLKAGDIAAIKVEKEAQSALLLRKAEIRIQIESLEIRSISDGIVVSRGHQQKLGQYVKPGDTFCTLGKPESLGAKAMLQQDDLKWLDKSSDVELHVWGSGEQSPIKARVKRIYPRATTSLPHPAFAASNGGPLAVISRTESEGTDEQEFMLTHPRVAIDLDIENDTLSSGQSGLMFISARDQNLGSYLRERVSRFLSRNMTGNHGL